MNELMATKTAPVTQKLTSIAVSIEVQLEAIGVRYQGVKR